MAALAATNKLFLSDYMEIDNFSDFFKLKDPNTDFWLLFKVSSYERLEKMRKGLLYMNSLEYFSSLEDEEDIALRVDAREKVFGVLRAGPNEQGFSTLSLKVGGEEVDLGSEAVLTAEFPKPKNSMIFCMGALADGENGSMPWEVDNKVNFDPQFLKFGSHLLLISKPKEFGDRLSKAILNNKNIFGSKLFSGGYGLVDYRKLDHYSGSIGLFTKDLEYSWQLEYRLAFGVEDHCLNEQGAFEFNIGDISDISEIVPVQALIDEPLSIKRRAFKKVGDTYKQISG
jgi:hypothetical protein